MITFTVENLKALNGALADLVAYLQEEHVPDETQYISKLVSCELITNVIRHCGEAATFTSGVKGHFVEIKVASKSDKGALPSPSLPDVFAENGRGLYIVKSLCYGDILSDGYSVQVKIEIKK
jgi:hypothetical protein